MPPSIPGHLSREYLEKYAVLFAHGARMRAVQRLIEEVSQIDATVLVRGESGVGKELVARALHAASARHAGPFVKVNCAALPADLLESELFGHEQGAFTGAYRRKLGKFEFAHGGTIFLDEIGELPLLLQPKILHVLQDLEFSRVGGRELLHVDARLIGATNRNLEAAVTRGEFRQDLYYRLNVIDVHIPPLRERRDEILSLATVFLARMNAEYRRHVELPPDLLEVFETYHWPGNVRELENIIRRLVVLQNSRHVREDLQARVRNRPGNGHPTDGSSSSAALGVLGSAPTPDAREGLKEIARRAAREGERQALLEVLERVRWNRAEAARILKVSYKTLLTKMAVAGLATKRQNSGNPG